MAISDLCKFEVRDEINHYVKKKGWSYRHAATVLAKELTELLEQEVKPSTLRSQAYRAEAKVVANATSDITLQQNTQSTRNQTNQTAKKKAKNGTLRGGVRKRAGRKPKAPRSFGGIVQKGGVIIGFEGVISDEFKQAYKRFDEAIVNAKRSKWKTTSQEAVLFHLRLLEDVTLIG